MIKKILIAFAATVVFLVLARFQLVSEVVAAGLGVSAFIVAGFASIKTMLENNSLDNRALKDEVAKLSQSFEKNIQDLSSLQSQQVGKVSEQLSAMSNIVDAQCLSIRQSLDGECKKISDVLTEHNSNTIGKIELLFASFENQNTSIDKSLRNETDKIVRAFNEHNKNTIDKIDEIFNGLDSQTQVVQTSLNELSDKSIGNLSKLQSCFDERSVSLGQSFRDLSASNSDYIQSMDKMSESFCKVYAQQNETLKQQTEINQQLVGLVGNFKEQSQDMVTKLRRATDEMKSSFESSIEGLCKNTDDAIKRLSDAIGDSQESISSQIGDMINGVETISDSVSDLKDSCEVLTTTQNAIAKSDNELIRKIEKLCK